VKMDPALQRGTLLRRYKRFLADIESSAGQPLTIHCPNTGAMTGCAEPGSEVWYSRSANPKRKYPHTLEVVIAAYGRVGVNTARANALIREALSDGGLAPFDGLVLERAEVPVPDESGRFDFLLRDPDGGRPCYVEVKNMTLCDAAGRGSFPDAVSERAIRHVRALQRRLLDGERAALVFCVQHSGIIRATLADEIHPAYGEAVRVAVDAGVEAYAFGVSMELDEIRVEAQLPLDLSEQRSTGVNSAG